MKQQFYNGIFHSMREEGDTFYGMEVSDGKISRIYHTEEEWYPFRKKGAVDLQKKHVYPCLIDGHIHMLLTISVMAMGIQACEITENGVEPNTLCGIEEKIRSYAKGKKKHEIIGFHNYITSAIKERRMPNKEELDTWGGGRPVVVYNIDGHSTALSSAMLTKIGIDPTNHTGVLTGEENENAQGRIINAIGKSFGPAMLAKGIANFHNYLADYGITMVGALEGNGDDEKDTTTALILHLARHFDREIRVYLQYKNPKKAGKYLNWMKHPRIGGCGEWEMDGSVGSRSAAFYEPFLDTGEIAPAYYSEKAINRQAAYYHRKGFQMASHAIGDRAIDMLLDAYEQLPEKEHKPYHRIEHFEFHSLEAAKRVMNGSYAIMMQPGYAWIDKRYLHSYEQALDSRRLKRMKLKSLMQNGVCICGSSDSPVQNMDPYLQMLGMVQFYQEDESLTLYEAMICYTRNAAKALLEEEHYGTLETGKQADFFTAKEDFFSLEGEQIAAFRPEETYYGGIPYKKKKGTIAELIRMMLSKPKMI